MKLKLLFTTLFAAGSMGANSQITIEENNVVGTYNMVFMAYDTISSGMTPGNAGTGQTWSYTFAQNMMEDTMMFTSPMSMPGYLEFPNSNLCYKLAGPDSTWWFFKKDANSLILKGKSWMDLGQLVTMEYNTTMLTFPSTMGTQYGYNMGFEAGRFFVGIDPDGAGPHLMVDSVRIIRDIDESSFVDGMGTIDTPLGSFGAIRQSLGRVIIDTFMMKTNNGWDLISPEIEMLFNTDAIDTTSQYITRWWTNAIGLGMPVMEMQHDALGNVFQTKWIKAMTQAQIEELEKGIVNIYPNPTDDIINISTIISDVDHVVIIDASGSVVKTSELPNGSGTLNAGDLDAGIYFLQLRNNSNEIIHSARVSVN